MNIPVTLDTRTLVAAVTAPLIAVGIFLGSAAVSEATAQAQPASAGQCTSMTMTDGRSGPSPSGLTRAGQVGSALGAGASDGSMAVDCQPAGHS